MIKLLSIFILPLLMGSIIPLYGANLPLINREIVVAIQTDKKVVRGSDYSAISEELLGSELILSYLPTDRNKYTSLFLIKKDNYSRSLNLVNNQNLLWVSDNKAFLGDPRDYTLSNRDPDISKQVHHKIIKTDMAHELSLGKEIIVAVTDDGADLNHEDLKGNFWHNSGEIPGNKIDDDNNGYIDDYNGWDFINGDNNPNERALGHGTHVTGIIAAVNDNGIGGKGIAPKVKIMPLKFYDFDGDWTPAIVAKTYTYAIENGADIITTSYGIDNLANNKTYLTVLDYAYNSGVLVFNSAGNRGELNPNRMKLDRLLLVGGTDTRTTKVDQKENYSNYGYGVDLMAPGYKIFSTSPRDRYTEKSGTSMAAPMAAAVAALIWSHNPSWSRDQVAAKLISSCDSIDSINKPRYRGLLGSGRLNGHSALTAIVKAPALGTATLSNNQIIVRLKDVLDAKLLNSSKEISLINIKTRNSYALKLARPYFIGANRLLFNSPAKIRTGTYKISIPTSTIKNPFGSYMERDYLKEIKVK